MNKTFTAFLLCILASVSSYAQIRFTDGSAELTKNSVVLNEKDFLGRCDMSIYVENTSSADQTVSIKVEVGSIGNGNQFQFCFPTQCKNLVQDAVFQSDEVVLEAGESRKVDMHFVPTTDAGVAFSIKLQGVASGATVATYEVSATYNMVTPVRNVEAEAHVVRTEVFDITGHLVSQSASDRLPKGIYIVRQTMSDRRMVTKKLIIDN